MSAHCQLTVSSLSAHCLAVTIVTIIIVITITFIITAKICVQVWRGEGGRRVSTMGQARHICHFLTIITFIIIIIIIFTGICVLSLESGTSALWKGQCAYLSPVESQEKCVVV